MITHILRAEPVHFSLEIIQLENIGKTLLCSWGINSINTAVYRFVCFLYKFSSLYVFSPISVNKTSTDAKLVPGWYSAWPNPILSKKIEDFENFRKSWSRTVLFIYKTKTYSENVLYISVIAGFLHCLPNLEANDFKFLKNRW